MGVEIEKKFLLSSEGWRGLGEGAHYCQGYLSGEKGRTVRVRTIDQRGILTIKGPVIDGVRLEYEYDIPVTEAREILTRLCRQPLVEKYRYKIAHDGFVWEVDEFLGDNQGLIFAEIELPARDTPFNAPDWVGREVTGVPRYYNSSLVDYPYARWTEAERAGR